VRRNGASIPACRVGRVTLRTAAWGIGLLGITISMAGCPLVLPWPGDVNASRFRTAAAGLRPDDGIVVIASRGPGARELEEAVISCLHDGLAKTSPGRLIVAPDSVLRKAFAAHDQLGQSIASEDLLNDPACREHVAQRKLRYSIDVSAEDGEGPRTWHAASGGGVGILTGQKAWYRLAGVAFDLSSWQMIGSIRAHAEAESFGFFWVPILTVWRPQWIRRGKVCQEFGREAADLIRKDKPLNVERAARISGLDPHECPGSWPVALCRAALAGSSPWHRDRW
jgi:hypothetical protein